MHIEFIEDRDTIWQARPGKIYRPHLKDNNMPKISHKSPNSHSPRNESWENNNMGTNVSVHFKELNDERGNLMAV